MTALPRVLALTTALAVAASVTVAAGGAAPAAAGTTTQSTLVSEVPSLSTPEVADGRVQALAQVGDAVVFGGSFTSVADRGGPAAERRYVAAYDRRTGRLLTGFAPALNGEVFALLPGPTAGTVYVAGAFTTLGGRSVPRLVLLSVTTGLPVSGFAPVSVNQTVKTLARVGDRLYVGGSFTAVGGKPHAGLASLRAGTGALDPYVGLQVAGHHNYGRYANVPKGVVGVLDLAVAPDGKQLTAIGNFRTVDGVLRDQVVVVDLSSSTAAKVRTDWSTTSFTSPCYEWAFDSWVRDVDYAPDGSYFVIGSTGGGNKDLCDGVARFGTRDRGTDVRPTWFASTGGDSVYSVAATGGAIYAGGHFRWFNNPLAVDVAGPGAVARPGIAALDPDTGLPLPWNPGRHPRDKGAFALLATDRELLVGTDTEWTGYQEYYTPRLTSFPLTGGAPLPTTDVPVLPGTLDRVAVAPDGTSATSSVQLGSTSVSQPAVIAQPDGLAGVRGVMVVGRVAYLAMADGTLHRRPYPGSATAADVVVDPYDDPKWATIATGYKGTTYRGLTSGWEQDLPSLTSMFYRSDRVYYTVSGSSELRSRAFEVATGTTSAAVQVVAGAVLPELVGGTYAGGYLYYARASDGALVRQGFDGTRVSSTTTVLSGPTVDGQDWRSAALFPAARWASTPG